MAKCGRIYWDGSGIFNRESERYNKIDEGIVCWWKERETTVNKVVEDVIACDIRKVVVSKEDKGDTVKWKSRTRIIDQNSCEEGEGKEENKL